jgi:prephenate dehydratase
MRKHKIAIQGTEASFHHLAAQRLFGEDILIESCTSFESVCQKIVSNDSDYGVMAIENLLTGCILTNYHLISRYQLNIIGEISLPIELHLMGVKSATLDSIKKVVSHPIALAQCNKLLTDKTWEEEQASDTATSARIVAHQQSDSIAAIANESTASLYGLSILAENVQDIDGNTTRFLVLSREKVRNSRANKACISFQLPHLSGSLAHVLVCVQDLGMNLSKIQSVPLAANNDQYEFIIDVEWNQEVAFEESINTLRKNVLELSVLGVYIKNEIIS